MWGEAPPIHPSPHTLHRHGLTRLSMAPLPRLGRQRLREIDAGAHAGLPRPVRVLQFGTGALLRGLVDDVLDRAARAGRWNGSAVVVSQTGSGRGVAFNEQDGLFTLRERGVEGGEAVERVRVITSVERALSAEDEWAAVLDVARDEMEVVVSNTTEIGLTWDDGDSVETAPPRSFPAKLAACLYERGAQAQFGHEPGFGVVVLPTELVEDNGAVLRDLVLRWGRRAGWGEAWARWVREECLFCTTLVDRIVTGTPPDLDAAERAVGHHDPLLTDAEPYRLWAIQPPAGTSPDVLRRRLPFADGDPTEGAGVVVVPSVEPFRLRKVRLLNAAHTLLVPVALGCGLQTVRQSVESDLVGAYLRLLLDADLVPAAERELAATGADPATARPFAHAVLDRFANPAVEHDLVGIALHQTAKLRARVAPALDHMEAPEAVALGVAAYLLLQKAAAGLDGRHFSGLDLDALPPDDEAEAVREAWRQSGGAAGLVRRVLSDASLWGASRGAGAFADAVTRHLERAQAEGVPAAVRALLHETPAAP